LSYKLRTELDKIDRQHLMVTSALMANSGIDPKKSKNHLKQVENRFDDFRRDVVDRFSRDKIHADRAMKDRNKIGTDAAGGENLRDDLWWEKPGKKRKDRKKRK
jgi:hypothetical protein